MSALHAFSVRHRHLIPHLSIFFLLIAFASFKNDSISNLDDLIVDAYAGATSQNVVVATPRILLSTAKNTPIITTVNGVETINTKVGQTVSINVSGSDPNGYNTYVYVGATQNNLFYYSKNQYINYSNGSLYLDTPKINLLPSGSTLTNQNASTSHFYNSTFNWTPQSTDAYSTVVVTFISSNYYFPATPKTATQSVTINVSDAAPVLSVSNNTLLSGVESKILVTATPDTASDTGIAITSNNLPSNASLSDTALNSNGNWVAVLDWTPTANQVGTTNISFNTQYEAQLKPLNQANNQTNISFTVNDNTTPTFSDKIPTSQIAMQGSLLTFNIIIYPDAKTNQVSLTPTNLPAGATLTQPVLQANNTLLATMYWTPNATQIGSKHTVTFTAEDKLPGATPVMLKTTFTIQSHYSSFSQNLRRFK